MLRYLKHPLNLPVSQHSFHPTGPSCCCLPPCWVAAVFAGESQRWGPKQRRGRWRGWRVGGRGKTLIKHVKQILQETKSHLCWKNKKINCLSSNKTNQSYPLHEKLKSCSTVNTNRCCCSLRLTVTHLFGVKPLWLRDTPQRLVSTDHPGLLHKPTKGKGRGGV